MKKEGKILISFALVLIFFLGIFLMVRDSAPEPEVSAPKIIREVRIAGQNIAVDLAQTSEEQAQGLSGRTGLGENEGMLFIFDKPGKYYFWMQGMNFPIDIIWIGEDMKVVYIQKDAKPEDFLETYGPDIETMYVLEVVAGFSDKYGLLPGDSVIFTF